jgi:hypothetical protein
MNGTVHIDEFVVVEKQKSETGRNYDNKKKKVVIAVEFSDSGKVKHKYTLKIDDFSAQELGKIFDKHIDKSAKTTINERRGCQPLYDEYDITQMRSNDRQNFIASHTIIHRVKSWIKTT